MLIQSLFIVSFLQILAFEKLEELYFLLTFTLRKKNKLAMKEANILKNYLYSKDR